MYTQFYEPRDMYIKKIKKMTRLRIRANVRYSDAYPDEMTAIQTTECTPSSTNPVTCTYRR